METLPVLAMMTVAACAPGAGRVAPSVPLGPPQTPLSQIRDEPGRFRGSTVHTSGRLEAFGAAPEGTWMELAPAAGGKPLVLVMTAATAPGTLDSWRGKKLELGLLVESPMILADGRRGVRATPLEVSTAIEPAASTAMPKELEEHLAKLPEAAVAVRTELFADPGLPSFSTDAPARVTLLDPDLKTPVWTEPRSVSLDRSGAPSSPSYRYRALDRSTDGAEREIVCRFRVENGRLRSVAYDETVRNPAGAVTYENHLDFVNGEGYDPLSGKKYPWPKNVYAAPCLPFAVTGFPLDGTRIVSFHLWSDWDTFTPVDVALDGPDRVSVPAGDFAAVRLRMNVNRERLVGSLALPMPQAYDMARDAIDQMKPPDTLYWLSARPPHLWLRTEGPMGPPGTSRGILERTALTAPERAALETSPAAD